MSNILTTWINGLTNDYDVVNGLYTKNNNLLTEVYARIVTPLGSYFFDDQFGSEIPNWLNTREILTSDKVVTELQRCTQIIINQGRAQTISSKLTAPLTNNAIFFMVNIIDNNGVAYQLDSNYVSIPSKTGI